METVEIKDLYPHCYYLMVSWAEDRVKDLPDQIAEITPVKAYLNYLCSHPYQLFEFMDSHDIFISTGWNKADKKFDCEIVIKSQRETKYHSNFDSRLEAEGWGLIEMFRILEKR